MRKVFLPNKKVTGSRPSWGDICAIVLMLLIMGSVSLGKREILKLPAGEDAGWLQLTAEVGNKASSHTHR